MLTRCRLTAGVIITIILAVSSLGHLRAAPRPLVSLESGMNDLVYDLSRSVVTVENIRKVGTAPVEGTTNETVENAVSSGVVCDTAGHILVSAAMIGGADHLNVTFENATVSATIVAIDYFNDIAVLQPQRRIGVPVRYSERHVCAGQMVIAMGHAYGLRASPTIGFCAGTRPDGTLQFSTAISASALGGGVFDLSGKLLGVIVGAVGQGPGNPTGMAVCAPAYQLPQAVSFLLSHGDRKAGYVGVSSADIEITPGIQVQMPYTFAGAGATPAGTVVDRGVIVTYVMPGSPAASAGLTKGDLIVGYQSQRITSAFDLARMVKLSAPGTLAEIAFIRRNSYQTVRVQVGYKGLTLPFSETDQFEPQEPSADSLLRVLKYLKQETTRLEQRLKRAHE